MFDFVRKNATNGQPFAGAARRWKRLQWISFAAVVVTTTAVMGCRRPTTPEQVYAQFVEAMESRNKVQAWKLLSKASRAAWDKAAALSGSKSGEALFQDGAMWQSRELRPNPNKPSVIKGNRASLHFFDSLNQHIQISLRKEQEGWRIHLQGAFLAGPAGMARLSRALPPRPRPTKAAVASRKTPAAARSVARPAARVAPRPAVPSARRRSPARPRVARPAPRSAVTPR